MSIESFARSSFLPLALLASNACVDSPVEKDNLSKMDIELVEKPCVEEKRWGVPVYEGEAPDLTVRFQMGLVQNQHRTCMLRMYSDRFLHSGAINFDARYTIDNPYLAKLAHEQTASVNDFMLFLEEEMQNNRNIVVAAEWLNEGRDHHLHRREMRREGQRITYKESLACGLMGDRIEYSFRRELSEQDFERESRVRPAENSPFRVDSLDVPQNLSVGTTLSDWMNVSQAVLRCYSN